MLTNELLRVIITNEGQTPIRRNKVVTRLSALAFRKKSPISKWHNFIAIQYHYWYSLVISMYNTNEKSIKNILSIWSIIFPSMKKVRIFLCMYVFNAVFLNLGDFKNSVSWRPPILRSSRLRNAVIFTYSNIFRPRWHTA